MVPSQAIRLKLLEQDMRILTTVHLEWTQPTLSFEPIPVDGIRIAQRLDSNFDDPLDWGMIQFDISMGQYGYGFS